MCPTICSDRGRNMEEENQLLHQRRKKTRRLKKRRYCNSKRNFEEVESPLVCKPLKLRRRGNSAPQNTTQFLIEDKMEVFPEYVISPSCSNSPSSTPSSASDSSSPSGVTPKSESENSSHGFVEGQLVEDFDEMYFQKDFEETYDQIREESLMSMPHSELLKQYLQLEMKEEELRKKVDCLSECACNNPFNVIVNVTCANCGTCAKVKSQPTFNVTEPNVSIQETPEKDLSREIEELRRKNTLLKEENKKLKCSLAVGEVRSC